MGQIRDKMVEDLKLAGYRPGTVNVFVGCAKRYVGHYMKSPTELGESHVREFMLYLKEQQKLQGSTQRMYFAAIRFLYQVTLKRPEVVAGIPWATDGRRKLPDIPSPQEAERIFNGLPDIKHRVILMTAYGAGLRVTEACTLGVADIDSGRMLIHVRDGKGGKDRFTVLPKRLLLTLREYWKAVRPTGSLLFPGKDHRRPITAKAVQLALHRAVKKARVRKRITPHGLRHGFATFLLDEGVDIRVIQALLGHSSIRSTALYTRVSPTHAAKVPNPLDRGQAPKRGRKAA